MVKKIDVIIKAYCKIKMGFDINVCLNVWIDETTGMPFVWGKNLEKLPYVPCEYEVPEKHRKYLKQRGNIFHFYIEELEGTSTDVRNFIFHYPNWPKIKHKMGLEDYGWTKADHDGFKLALEWLAAKEVFGITWSY